MNEQQQFAVNITGETLNRLRLMDENAWYKLMYCATTEANEKLYKENLELKENVKD
tara:strand:- start:2048 stop:2215 length:168 start_codon:yes stop_codon:yes gene_type:complete